MVFVGMLERFNFLVLWWTGVKLGVGGFLKK
jgi:hypothetical protein